MSKYDTYTSPLAERNASRQMLELWSPRHKFNTWRCIWLAVAEAQHKCGLPVTKEQVEELRAVVARGITDDEMQAAEKYERELRHDVMAHVHALGDSCPKAKGIIHLGMTSQDVVCNADRAIVKDAIWLINCKIIRVCVTLGTFGGRYKALPTLGFTHYQPAQPVTVGRRACMWATDLHLHHYPRGRRLLWRGLRGATGTQASFLQLCNGDGDLVDRLEMFALQRMVHGVGDDRSYTVMDDEYLQGELDEDIARHQRWAEQSNLSEQERAESKAIAEELRSGGLEGHRQREINYRRSINFHNVTGQTYPRVEDAYLVAELACTAAVLHKIATDIRLLCNRKELDEPFEDKQIGSSAMPYKRNPMRCERICGLTRFVMNLVGNAYDTAATQWLERTLDDSSNRRLSLPEAFLALDGALDLMHNVSKGLIVHEAMVKKNLMAELPFMATENILMECVKLGGDRQHYHELIRVHAQAAGHRVKHEGLDNDLLDRLKADPNFHSKARGGPLSADLNWDGLMDPMKYIGRSIEQTDRFLRDVIDPLREQYKDDLANLEESAPKV